jgi:hypothetical protein
VCFEGIEMQADRGRGARRGGDYIVLDRKDSIGPFQVGLSAAQAIDNLAQTLVAVLELKVGAVTVDERGPNVTGELGVLRGDFQLNNQAVFGVCKAAGKDRGGIVGNDDGHVTCLKFRM